MRIFPTFCEICLLLQLRLISQQGFSALPFFSLSSTPASGTWATLHRSLTPPAHRNDKQPYTFNNRSKLPMNFKIFPNIPPLERRQHYVVRGGTYLSGPPDVVGQLVPPPAAAAAAGKKVYLSLPLSSMLTTSSYILFFHSIVPLPLLTRTFP